MTDAPPEWGEIPPESICLTMQRKVHKTQVILSGRSFRLKMGHEGSKWKDKNGLHIFKGGRCLEDEPCRLREGMCSGRASDGRSCAVDGKHD